MQPVTTAELKNVVALSELPEEHLHWLVNHGECREYEDGAVLTRAGDPAVCMWILLQGRLSYYMDVNGILVYYLTFENSESTGGVTGMMPHSRMKVFAGCWNSLGTVRMLLLDKKYFAELELLNPDFIQRLIGFMTERAKMFATIQLQYEKVSALGKLSAGIAHELNNPAAAITRIASELIKRVKLSYALTENLIGSNVDRKHLNHIRNMVEEKEVAPKNSLSMIQKMEKEDEFAEWQEKNGIGLPHDTVEAFSESGFSIQDIENIKGNLDKETFMSLMRWLENLLSSQRIIQDLENASARISKLVGAVKSHVQMDRTNDLQQTNLNNDIENTLTLLGHKLREKNITVKNNFNMLHAGVEAYIGELNQVWTNIIDNAIYAMDNNGELIIDSSSDNKNVMVRITDNGEGIPPGIISRIFDPFFTTKKTGQGTGIGLDLVSRIINHHQGEIKVNSVPGKTVFEIIIPVKHQPESSEKK